MKLNLFLLSTAIAIVFCSCSKKTAPPEPSDEKSFISFSFTITQNPNLPQDISCEIIGDTIYAFTFSGTDVTNLKPSFTSEAEEVLIGDQKQLSNQAAHNFSSPVTYTLKAADNTTKNYVVKFNDTKLPVLSISTNNVPIDSKDTYIPGHVTIKQDMTGDSLFGGDMEIKGRGNSTWDMPKKPYKFKLGKKAGLLGMYESKQWVLLANYADKSLIRNEVAFEVSRRAGLAYTPAGRFVDVILNGKYIGNYELVEQIDVGEHKVNIHEQEEGANTLPEISGGYLTEVDGFAFTEAVNFLTPRGMPVAVHYPDDDEITDAQKIYITNHYNKFEDSLFAENFTDINKGYQQYFDLDSYVNYYIVNEVMGNPDIFWSTYMYKDYNNDKLYSGPVWDFDIAANNDDRIGDAVNSLMFDVAHEPRLWINRLMEDPAFRKAVRERWNTLKANINTVPAFADALALQLQYSQAKNFQRWNILQEKVYRNFQVAGSYKGETDYLKNYLTNRIAWLDATFNGSRFD